MLLRARAGDDSGLSSIRGGGDKERIADVLEDCGLLTAPTPVVDGRLAAPGRHGHTRAFVKVQDGCDNHCSYCVVTVARGPGRSLPGDQIVAEIRQLGALGYREVVLTGVHLGSYGHDRGDLLRLHGLLERLLSETTVERLRLSSLEPWDAVPALFALFQDPRLLPHLPLPLQSGSDETLRRMARRTTRRDFSNLVEQARTAVPGVAISTDIMVGFPGETDDDFEQSVDLVESLAFSRVHVFRYSPRPGTRAATMPDQVPGALAEDRSKRMRALAKRLQARHSSSFVDRVVSVLWEQSAPTASGLRWSGLSEHYVRVMCGTPADVDLGNTITATQVLAADAGRLRGRPVG